MWTPHFTSLLQHEVCRFLQTGTTVTEMRTKTLFLAAAVAAIVCSAQVISHSLERTSERTSLPFSYIISLSPRVASSVARLRAPKQRARLLVSVWQTVLKHLLQGRTLILSWVAFACEAKARQGSCNTLAYETLVLLWGASNSQMCCMCRVGLRCLCKLFRDLPILVFTFAPDGIFGEGFLVR